MCEGTHAGPLTPAHCPHAAPLHCPHAAPLTPTARGGVQETMADQIREWFIACRDQTGKFPEFPDAEDGGSKTVFAGDAGGPCAPV